MTLGASPCHAGFSSGAFGLSFFFSRVYLVRASFFLHVFVGSPLVYESRISFSILRLGTFWTSLLAISVFLEGEMCT